MIATDLNQSYSDLHDDANKETKCPVTYQMHTWLQNCLNFQEFPSSNNTKFSYITSEPEEDKALVNIQTGIGANFTKRYVQGA